MHNGKHMVLIVDDEPGILDVISVDLKNRGYDVLTASQGREALQHLERSPIDLVISDIRMAELGGVALLKEVRRRFRGPTPAVIMISGHLGMDVEEAYALGAQGLLSKPFSRKLLLHAVETCLAPLKDRWAPKADFKEDLAFEIDVGQYEKALAEKKIAFGWGGFFLHTPDVAPDVGQNVRFKLTIRSPHAVELSGGGRVVWKREVESEDALPGIGVEFLFFEPLCLDAALAWLEASQAASHIPDGRSTLPPDTPAQPRD